METGEAVDANCWSDPEVAAVLSPDGAAVISQGWQPLVQYRFIETTSPGGAAVLCRPFGADGSLRDRCLQGFPPLANDRRPVGAIPPNDCRPVGATRRVVRVGEFPPEG